VACGIRRICSELSAKVARMPGSMRASSQSEEFVQIVGMIGIEVMHITVRVEQQRIVLIQWFIAVVLMVTDGRCFLDAVAACGFAISELLSTATAMMISTILEMTSRLINTVNGILMIQGNNVRNVSAMLA
jgi:hypothetical protein